MRRLAARRLRRWGVDSLLGCALLLGAITRLGAATTVPPGDVFRVKRAAGDTIVQVIPTPFGGLVRADVVARLLGGVFDSLPDGQWRLTIHGAAIDLTPGSVFAALDSTTLPLIEAMRVVDGAPLVPLQLFSEVLPRLELGIAWDRARAELRAMPSLVRRPPTVVAHATPPVSTAVAAASAARAAGRATPSTAAPVPAGLSRRYTVVVDAGHGGKDPGMKGPVVDGVAFSEARVTLEVSRRLKDVLEQKGIQVVMTRTRDTLIALRDRGPIANRANGDLFLSIHVNAANPKWANPTGARGFETYFLSTARTEDEAHVANMENEVVRFETEVDGAHKGDALSFILNDLARNEHLRESSEVAATIQRRMQEVHPGPDRGVKQALFSVLVRTYMPAVLVELGFGTNPSEARWMASPRGQQETAEAIAEAALDYLTDYDRRTRTASR
ncbi:MAG: N-acetylmuramoyl-L-alanine amidase [Gemmatimonadota bacterium]